MAKRARRSKSKTSGNSAAPSPSTSPAAKLKTIQPKKAVAQQDDDELSSESDGSSVAPTLVPIQPQQQQKHTTQDDDDESASSEDDEPNPNTTTTTSDDSVSTEESDASPTAQPQHSTEPAPTPTLPLHPSDGRYHNKRRTLILSSRGITSRQRHLLEDFRTLLPHHKKEGKLDVGNNAPGGIGRAIDDIAEMRGCNNVLFLECRKRQDAYLWLGGGKEGPSAKFLVENVHTMDELRLTGNCMKGSRPLLSFDGGFEEREEMKLLKCMFVDIFGTPRGHPKSKPFVDRVMGFYYVDGKIWVRNYQIVETTSATAEEARTQKKLHGSSHSTSMVEIGPRFVLNPIRIFRGSFGGQTLFQNQNYISPNAVRSARARDRGMDYKDRKDSQDRRKRRKEAIVVPEDPLGKVFA